MVKLVTLAPGGARLLSTSSRLDRWVLENGCTCLVEITNSFICRELSYKLVVVGGGAGGCGTANKFANKLGKDQVFGGNVINLTKWEVYVKHQQMSGCSDRTRRDALLPAHVDPGKKTASRFYNLPTFPGWRRTQKSGSIWPADGELPSQVYFARSFNSATPSSKNHSSLSFA